MLVLRRLSIRRSAALFSSATPRALAAKPPVISSSGSSTGTGGASAADTEKYVADLQREIRTLYTNEQYDAALSMVSELHDVCVEFYGPEHPVSASAINNRALLTKSVGKFADAVDLFTEAIQAGRHWSTALIHSHRATQLGTTTRQCTIG